MTNTRIKRKNQVLIGVMDSGVGGLSVLAHCQQRLPNAAFLYVADSQYAPYGAKSATQISQRCHHIADYLLQQNVQALVVACNTATAAAIKSLRASYALPIIGMEPAVKPAVDATRNKVIGVLATTGTLQSAKFAALLADYGQSVVVKTQACNGLVECVERGALDTPETLALLKHYCTPLMAAGVDTIVLGCTHYPFLKPAIQAIVGESVTLIDTGEAVARQLVRQLQAAGLNIDEESGVSPTPALTVLTNSQAAEAAAVIQALWGALTPLTVRSITL